MSETHGFIKILPDSTGKRVPQTVMMELNFDNGTIPFKIGDILSSGTSLISGTIYEVEGTTSAGLLHIKIPDPVPPNPVFTIGENLIVNSVTNAKAASAGIPFYFQQMNVTGFRNPLAGWDINDDGSGIVSFPTGNPNFDAFGKIQISQQHTLGEYLNKYEMDTEYFTNMLTGTASIVHDSSSAGLVFSTGTANGDKAERISNRYHMYQMGYSQLIQITCAVGDAGKTNVKRTWGYGDDNDGIFWVLSGTTFNTCLKSSVTGSVVDTCYPQSEWNADRLDGSKGIFNESGITLDITKNNIYWIDFQWLGAGKIRFGVNIDGKRVICHTINNANKNTRPYMRTGALPVYFEQENIGAVGSSSEFRLWCCAVKTEGEFTPEKIIYSTPGINKTITSTTQVPLFSIRSKQTYGAITNRMSSYIEGIDVISLSAPIQISILEEASLTGAAWDTDTGHATVYDTSATVVSGGSIVDSFYVATGEAKTFDSSSFFNHRAHVINLKADGTSYHYYTVTARLISAGSSVVEITPMISDV